VKNTRCDEKPGKKYEDIITKTEENNFWLADDEGSIICIDQKSDKQTKI
jgi:hypothetical protein